MALKGHYANPDLRYSARKFLDLAQTPEHALPQRAVRKPQKVAKAKRLQALEIDDLCVQYVAGKTIRQLATQFSIHRTTVMNHLERNGINRRASERKMNDRMIEEAVELRKTGLAYAKLGMHFGVDAETVRRELMKIDLR